jgi:hypothetical protein
MPGARLRGTDVLHFMLPGADGTSVPESVTFELFLGFPSVIG